jgi:hypothetical protein
MLDRYYEKIISLTFSWKVSLAFNLVTSIPTNFIFYQAGYFTMWDMAKVGIFMAISDAICTTQSICAVRSLLGIITF